MNEPIALVTGSSRGIGAAIARQLRERGMRVIGHATREMDHETIASDLAVPGAASRLWKEAMKRADGRIDVLVNNAGRFEENPIDLPHDEWLENWEQTLRINLTAAAELSRLAVSHWTRAEPPWPHRPHRKPRRPPRRLARPLALCRVEGRDARHAQDHRPPIRGAGHPELRGLPRLHRHRHGGRLPVRPQRGAILAEIPLGRAATADEIATMAAFCALDAPPSMTGAVLDANGASYVR